MKFSSLNIKTDHLSQKLDFIHSFCSFKLHFLGSYSTSKCKTTSGFMQYISGWGQCCCSVSAEQDRRHGGYKQRHAWWSGVSLGILSCILEQRMVSSLQLREALLTLHLPCSSLARVQGSGHPSHSWMATVTCFPTDFHTMLT